MTYARRLVVSVLVVLVLFVSAACAEESRTEQSDPPAFAEATAASPAATPTMVEERAATEEASAYLRTALDYIQTGSVMRDRVDWPTLRRDAWSMVAGARTPADTYPAIRATLARLGDRHSFFLSPDKAQQFQAGTASGFGFSEADGVVIDVAPDGPAAQAGVQVGDLIEWRSQRADVTHFGLRRADTSDLIEVELQPGPYTRNGTPRGMRLPGSIGYIEIPQMSGVGEAATAFATAAQAAIREVDGDGACGWVVDLRRNVGGSTPPMVAGIGPVLGEGAVGGWADALGPQTWVEYRDGQELLRGMARSRVDGPAYVLKRPAPPVAVLTSRRTASAGEVLAIYFRGRPETQSFGEPTTGVPTGNSAQPFSDGALLVLTVALGMDRTGRTYAEALPPDVLVRVDWRRFMTDEDPVLGAATAWLAEQPACAQN